MDRRDFLGVCSASAGLAFAGDARPAGPLTPKAYVRARLLDASGAPLALRNIALQRNYVFFYPYKATPCFLLKLGKSAPGTQIHDKDADYPWPGGVGPDRSVVAYSAICSHQLAYPTRDISFISFRSGRSGANRHADVIHCCSEHSQYDPAQGARVVAGPAPSPLAAIMLDYDANADALYAVGTLGTEVFNEFFRRYAFKLAMEWGEHAQSPAGDECRVTELDNFCRQQVRC